jgi:hypothetical protein
MIGNRRLVELNRPGNVEIQERVEHDPAGHSLVRLPSRCATTGPRCALSAGSPCSTSSRSISIVDIDADSSSR